MGKPLQLEKLESGLAQKIAAVTDLVWYEGDDTILQKPLAAVVGTRNVSEDGLKRTRRLVQELVALDFGVVSGLALGVDGEAHNTAISLGGKTIGVIGTPLNRSYPAEHAGLQREIASKGLLISQFAPGHRTTRGCFPRRNVLMGALADVTFVVEAGENSGTRHQVEAALRYGRRVAILASLASKSYPWILKALKNPRTSIVEDAASVRELLEAIKSEHKQLPDTAETQSKLVFISHANPEDNAFTQWLALQLTRSGYKVWCDLSQFTGGENMWQEIEVTLRQKTAKFIFVISRTSNSKSGTIAELTLARTLAREREDFIIPVRVDDLPFGEMNIHLGPLMVVDFTPGWHAGLNQLLKKLSKDSVPRALQNGPNEVTQLWRKQYPEHKGLSDQKEDYASNLFHIEELPKTIYLHRSKSRFGTAPNQEPGATPYWQHKAARFSFRKHLVEKTEWEMLDLAYFLSEGISRMDITPMESKRIVKNLIRRELESHALASGLRAYAMSGRTFAFWMPRFGKERHEFRFEHIGGEMARRSLAGYNTLTNLSTGVKTIRNWHFALSFSVVELPQLAVMAQCHVVYSEDEVLYESRPKQHRCRRKHCANWFNDAWVDRMLAMMAQLKEADASHISCSLGDSATLAINVKPLLFESQVSYSTTDIDAKPTEVEEELETEEIYDLDDEHDT